MNKVKLNQYIAQVTGMSRREASDELKAGKVKLNNRNAEFWEEVEPGKDRVVYLEKEITLPEKMTTIVLNKPAGYVTTRNHKYDEKIVMDLLPENLQKLKPVGRLDADSEGLLILTDDGDKIYEWTHPKFGHEKEYVLTLKKTITEELLQKFTEGIRLSEGIAVADYVEKISAKELNIVIHQGWKHQLRRMAEKCRNEVVKLKRIRMGDVVLGSLKTGEWKKI